MLIYKGVKPQDVDALVVWPTGRGDVVAARAWSLTEAVTETFSNLVKANASLENPEEAATLAVTKALETGVALMEMAFAPNAEMVEEISMNLGVGKTRVMSDE